MRILNSKTAAVAAAGALLVVAGAGGATAAGKISGKQIKSHSIGINKLKSSVIARIDAPGPQGPAGPAGTPPLSNPNSGSGGGAILGGKYVSPNAVPVATIGGSFASGQTVLGSFALPAGTYQINGDAFFDRSDNTKNVNGTRMMLAIRSQDKPAFGDDLGTCFTTPFPSASVDREVTCSTTRLITLSTPTTIYVKAFGYNDDTSGDTSGNVTVKANVSAVEVN